MSSWKNLTLAVALAAGATVALANGAMAYDGGYHGGLGAPVMVAASGPYATGFGFGSNYGSSYSGNSYGGGRVGSARYKSYRAGRYSGPYRTDSAPLSGGGY